MLPPVTYQILDWGFILAAAVTPVLIVALSVRNYRRHVYDFETARFKALAAICMWLLLTLAMFFLLGLATYVIAHSLTQKSFCSIASDAYICCPSCDLLRDLLSAGGLGSSTEACSLGRNINSLDASSRTCFVQVMQGVRASEFMADVIVAESKIHDLGVFARRDFAEGEIILFIDDSRVVDDAHPLHPELGEHSYHCDYLANGKTILMRSPERHINSCCAPNTYVKTVNGVRHVVARTPIKAGEEITCDYIIDCHGGLVWQCSCGSPRCRGTIVSSFFELPLDLQLEYLPLLNEWFIEEHQDRIEALQRRAAGA